MEERIYSYSYYLRSAFGERVQRISIDAGFSCPNLDGTLSRLGCSYCNNKAFVRFLGQGKSIKEQIENSIEYYEKRFGLKKFIAYFQSFSNTHADIRYIAESYNVIRDYPQIVGLSISTRPDCVDKEKIKLIAGFQKDFLVWVEYGLQTTNNKLLAQINRGHTYEDFLSALELSRKFNINTGVHMIIGLPGSGYDDYLLDARRLAGLKVQGVKFHIFHILKGTAYEQLYSQGKIRLLEKDEYVKIICDILEVLPKELIILRLVSNAYPEYLIAPFWINDKSRVINQIKERLADRGAYQGRLYENPTDKS